jgi:hypothetical protein
MSLAKTAGAGPLRLETDSVSSNSPYGPLTLACGAGVRRGCDDYA